MNKRATETNLNKEEFEQLKEAYVSTIAVSYTHLRAHETS